MLSTFPKLVDQQQPMATPGDGRSSRKPRRWLGLVLGLAAGCASGRPHVDQALLADKGARPAGSGGVAPYAAACPDVLEIAVARRPDLTGEDSIDPCGCIRLGNVARLRVEGLPTAAIARKVAAAAGAPTADVQVRVADFKSQQIYLFGEVAGLQRAVPYQGPETVLDMLQRAGGITTGASPGHVYVIRSHVADAGQPEVFHVDLDAIVMNHDTRTNLRLEPSDQVYVGESRRSSLEKCVPPCLRPVYEMLCGLAGARRAKLEPAPDRPDAQPGGPAMAPPDRLPNLR
jgi:protein involved in polysaccharide export with SLBB domain